MFCKRHHQRMNPRGKVPKGIVASNHQEREWPALIPVESKIADRVLAHTLQRITNQLGIEHTDDFRTIQTNRLEHDLASRIVGQRPAVLSLFLVLGNLFFDVGKVWCIIPNIVQINGEIIAVTNLIQKHTIYGICFVFRSIWDSRRIGGEKRCYAAVSDCISMFAELLTTDQEARSRNMRGISRFTIQVQHMEIGKKGVTHRRRCPKMVFVDSQERGSIL